MEHRHSPTANKGMTALIMLEGLYRRGHILDSGLLSRDIRASHQNGNAPLRVENARIFSGIREISLTTSLREISFLL